MSKKKKKTRLEKSTKAHDFVHLKNFSKIDSTVDENSDVSNSKKTDLIDPNYIFDLKKVLFFIALFVILIGIITFLVYKTQVFNFIFGKYNIKY